MIVVIGLLKIHGASVNFLDKSSFYREYNSNLKSKLLSADWFVQNTFWIPVLLHSIPCVYPVPLYYIVPKAKVICAYYLYRSLS